MKKNYIARLRNFFYAKSLCFKIITYTSINNDNRNNSNNNNNVCNNNKSSVTFIKKRPVKRIWKSKQRINEIKILSITF